jgi:hypothetical protein
MNRREFVVSAGAAAIVPFIPFVPRCLGVSERPSPELSQMRPSDIAWEAVISIGCYHSPVGSDFREPGGFNPILFLYLYTNVQKRIDSERIRSVRPYDKTACATASILDRRHSFDSQGNLKVFSSKFYDALDGVPVSQEDLSLHWTPEAAFAALWLDDKIHPVWLAHMKRIADATMRAPSHLRPCTMVELIKGASHEQT